MDKNVADMVELPDLTAPYVLHNLKHRFLNRQIYVTLLYTLHNNIYYLSLHS